MKRLLMVVSTLNNGGAQRIFSNIMMNLPDEWEIDILLNDTENIAYPYKGRLISLGMKSQMDKTSLVYQAKVFIRRVCVLRRLKKEKQYRACISALTSANAVNVLTGSRHCKTILTVHNFMSKDSLQGIKKRIIRFSIKHLYNKADIVTVVSESARQDLVRNFGVRFDKTVTLYNGYDTLAVMTAAASPLSSEEAEWFHTNGPVLSTMGRLSDQKGQWHLLRAMKSIKKDFPDARLLLLGEGELETYLRKLVRQCGMEKSVVFCGFRENPHSIIAKCDAFVLPSLYEGFPNAVVEALCCQVPCICADFDSGAREILEPDSSITEKVKGTYVKAEYGLLCPVCDGKKYGAEETLSPEESLLADAVTEMLKNRELSRYYREKGMERARQLDISQIIHSWIRLIEE